MFMDAQGLLEYLGTIEKEKAMMEVDLNSLVLKEGEEVVFRKEGVYLRKDGKTELLSEERVRFKDGAFVTSQPLIVRRDEFGTEHVHFGSQSFRSGQDEAFDPSACLEKVKDYIDAIVSFRDMDTEGAALDLIIDRACPLADFVRDLHNHISQGGALPVQWTPERIKLNMERIAKNEDAERRQRTWTKM
jgi:hypothetical protein